jgi:hypothetical protein
LPDGLQAVGVRHNPASSGDVEVRIAPDEWVSQVTLYSNTCLLILVALPISIVVGIRFSIVKSDGTVREVCVGETEAPINLVYNTPEGMTLAGFAGRIGRCLDALGPIYCAANPTAE